MAFVGSMLGAGQGSDYEAGGNPAKGQSPISQEQINNSYTGVQNSMQAQQGLLAALQQQNGLGNQNQVYGQLQGVANGTGPSAAQSQYKQNANQIGAQTAGLIGSQKGMSPALQARLMAQQGAAAQQNAAGQGAANQAAEQLGAMNAAGNIANTQAGNQIGQTNANVAAQQGQQQTLLGTQAQMYGNANTTDASIQVQNSKAQQGIFGGLLGGAGGILSDENAKTNIHSADDKIQQFLDSLGAHEYNYKDSVQGEPGTAPGKQVGPMAQELEHSEIGKQMVTNTPEGKGLGVSRSEGVILAALSSINNRLKSFEGGQKMAQGGQVQGGQVQSYADGGTVSQPFQNPFQPNVGGPQSGFARFIGGMGNANQQNQQGGENPIQSGMSKLTEKIGEKYIKPLFESAPVGAEAGAGLGSEVGGGIGAAEGAEGAATAIEGAEALEGTEAAYGGSELLAALAKGGSVGGKLKAGGKVPGSPKFKGDNPANDTVDARLSPGEVVIPNSIMQGKNPAKGAKDFVASIIAKRKGRK